MTVQARAGQPAPLDAEFIVGAVLTDADDVTLDITYGGVVGMVPDYAGPFTLSGGQVTRTATGEYACTWQVPAGAVSGDYVANWTFSLGGVLWPATENVWVTGSSLVPVPAGDVGFWTGALVYAAAGEDIEFGQADADGTTWIWQKLTGWDSPPVQGGGVLPKSGDHGAWPTPQFYAARPLTLTCTASAKTQALRDEARVALQSAVPVSDLAILRYDEPVPKQALVRRSGQVGEAYPTLCDVTFTVGMIAPDPRKYGTIQKQLVITPLPSGLGGGMVVPFTVPFTLVPATPPGEALCVNAGSFPSPPVVVIYGPCSAPVLANLTTGQQVSWSQLTLVAGETLFVDFLNRQAWGSPPNPVPGLPGQPPGGGSYQPADPSSAWWQLAKGENAVEFTCDNPGGASAGIFWYDAYV